VKSYFVLKNPTDLIFLYLYKCKNDIVIFVHDCFSLPCFVLPVPSIAGSFASTT